MVKSRLYTRGGDTGMTSLVGGQRIRKNCARLEAYGTLDEFSSFLGCVSSDDDCPMDIKAYLLEIQNMLFNLGGYLACEVKDGEESPVWGLQQEDLALLEKGIDELDVSTPPVNAFVLPGGCRLSAATHVARAVCRRAERRILALAECEYVDPLLLCYMNRLSDYLFILARNFNHRAGVDEIKWHK